MESGLIFWIAFCIFVWNGIGCSGCISNLDCTSGYVCCKKSIPSQAFCSEKCVGEFCNNNGDCAGSGECCRDTKCASALKCALTACEANSECHSGEFCCRREPYLLGHGRCRGACVGKDCHSDDDCGPPKEICNLSDNKCSLPENHEMTPPTEGSSPPTEGSSPPTKGSSQPWRIAVIVVAVLIAVGVSIAVLWYYKRKRPGSNTHSNNGSRQDTQNQGTVMTHLQPNIQFTGFNNPTQQQGTAFAPNPPTNQFQQPNHITMFPNPPPRYDDGYVNPIDKTYENPDIALAIQRQGGPQFYPQNAFNAPDNPPPYPGNHP